MGFFKDAYNWWSTGGNPGRQTNLEAGKNENYASDPLGPGGVVRAKDPLDQSTKKTPTAKKSSNVKSPKAKAVSDKQEKPQFRQSSNENIQEGSTQNEAFGLQRNKGQSFNIARFRAEVTENDGVLPTHSFLVVFAPMKWITNNQMAVNMGLDSLLTMRCDNVVLPSINLLQEQNIRRFGFGPVENVAYGVNVGDLSMQFIVDKNAQVVDFFEAWMNMIVNRDSYGGANINNRVSVRKTPYEVAYKDDYACTSVNVFVYDRAQNNVMEYNIYDVFPTGIQSVNMSWAEENTLLRLNVTFSFTDIRIRPTFSAFGQDAGQRAGSKMFDEMNADYTKNIPESITAFGDLPVTQPGSYQLEATVGPPLVIGEGNNGAPRNFATPKDVGPGTSTTPLVPAPGVKNAFGQVQNIA